MIKKTIRDLIIISAVFAIATEILFGYLSSVNKMDSVYRNWDGPGYILVAKTLYDPNLINRINPFPFTPKYWTLTYPLYPVFIRLFSFIGYPQSMILVSTIFTLLFIIAFYFLLRKLNPQANALVVCLLLIFYPPRWFIVSHVGSSEPLFLFLEVMFLIFFMKKQFFLSAICAGLAAVTKANGLFLLAAVSIYGFLEIFIWHTKSLASGVRQYLPFLLVPVFPAALYTLYYFRFGDFFSYSHSMSQYYYFIWGHFLGMFTHIPAGDYEVWKEGLVYTFLIYLIAIHILVQKKQYLVAIIGGIYYLGIMQITFTDISRYFLPLLPMAFLAYANGLSKKPVYLAMLLCVPLVYLYAIGYINFNVAEAIP